MKSGQELIHWLETGGGARWVRRAAVVVGTIALSLVIVWKQFHGPATETTLLQADVARQLARGDGFTTLVNFPQSVAMREAAGHPFDATHPSPELHHAPLYSVVLAAGLKLVPDAMRQRLFTVPNDISEGFGADYYLLAVNLALFWAAAWLTFLLGRQLFDPRVGWTAALAMLVSWPLWQQTLACNGTSLLMVLVLAAFLVWRRVDAVPEKAAGITAGPTFICAAFGGLCGLLFLCEYSAGTLVVVAAVYVLYRFREAARWFALAALLIGFLLPAAPWAVRNIQLTGNPVGLALANVALKAGDSTAEPTASRATLSADLPAISLRKLGNKTLTLLQETVRSRLWGGGALWFVAFFVAGWIYAFRSAQTNRLRWWFSISFGVLLLAQSALNSGESERLVVYWLAPLVILFGAGFFFVLLSSNVALNAWPRACAGALIVLQALPLVHDAMAPPPGVRFQYPPYFPALIRGLKVELEIRGASDRFGIMADVPAGVAWYAGARCWAQPSRMRDFYAITLQQPIGELLLTPRTLDRPFLSELNARGVAPGALSGVANRFGEWGEIYGGLVTGTMPREFPLKVPHKVAENLYVLLNPALPSPRGK